MDCKEEVRNGYVVTSKMKKVWNVQMEICKEIFRVCQKYNIKIVCCGGTAIGVMREHGYIPWDDDIDLEMLREDYEKLCAVAKDEFREPFFFQTAHTDNGYCYGHAQVRKSGTAAILKGDVFNKFHMGIFVDIFILDAVPANEVDLQKLRTKTLRLRDALNFKAFSHFFWGNPCDYVKSFIKNLRYLPFPLEKLFSVYENCFKENDSPKSSNVCSMEFTWATFDKVIRPASMMDHIEWLPFEDMMMPVPANCSEILTRQYGDFMKPAKSPSMHGGFLVLDAEHDFRTYLPELRKQMIKSRFRRLIAKIGLG